MFLPTATSAFRVTTDLLLLSKPSRGGASGSQADPCAAPVRPQQKMRGQKPRALPPGGGRGSPHRAAAPLETAPEKPRAGARAAAREERRRAVSIEARRRGPAPRPAPHVATPLARPEALGRPPPARPGSPEGPERRGHSRLCDGKGKGFFSKSSKYFNSYDRQS